MPAATLLTALAFAAQPAPPPARRLSPTIPVLALDWPDWQLRRAPGSCAAGVALGRDARLLLAYDARNDMNFLYLVDPALALRAGDRREARLRIGDNAEESVPVAVDTVSERDRTAILAFYASRFGGRLRRIGAAGRFTLTIGDGPAVTYQVPGAGDGVRRILDCAEEARAALPEAERMPRASAHGYFSANDYPGMALGRREQGTVRFAVTVNAEGRVADCQILESSGSRTLDDTTCRIVRQRLRYRPARDGQGRPVAARDGEYSVTWRLP